MSRAIELFDAGAQSLGLLGGPPNLDEAAKLFEAAASADSQMCDAFLGQADVLRRLGEPIPADLTLQMYSVRHRLGEQQARLGFQPGALHGQMDLLAYGLTGPVFDHESVCAAYAYAMFDARDGAEAEFVLNEQIHSGADSHYAIFASVAIAHAAERWDLLVKADLQAVDKANDEKLSAAALLMVADANAHLGRLSPALDMVDQVLARWHKRQGDDDSLQFIWAPATYLKGMVLRARGDEEQKDEEFAQKLFAQLASFAGHDERYRSASDPGRRLVVVDQAVLDTRSDPWDPTTGEDPSAVRAADNAAKRKELLEEAQERLDSVIGMDQVKAQLAKLQASVQMGKLRAEQGLAQRETGKSLHLIFTGPPGTGKTTIADVVAKNFAGLGVVATDKLVEVTRKDLVGQHLGVTAKKTNAVIDSALDGVLFIDEAYSLDERGYSGGDAYGREAVTTLLERMDKDRHRLIVIIAGYPDDIDQFLDSNEGLRSRFAKRINFSSYSPDELVAIAEYIAAAQGSRLDAEAVRVLRERCVALTGQTNPDGRALIDVVGNGRFIRNVVEAAEEERDYRLLQNPPDSGVFTADELVLITAADMELATSYAQNTALGSTKEDK